jgi:dTDP-glucose pyrophosphorylase
MNLVCPVYICLDPMCLGHLTGNDAVKPSPRGELEITDLYTLIYLEHNYKVETEKIGGLWLDPGKV